MSRRATVLSVVLAFVLPMTVLGGKALGAVAPIQAVKGVKPKASVFKVKATL